MKAYFSKQTKWTTKAYYASFGFLNESLALNEIEELEGISLPTAAIKEDTGALSSEFREGLSLKENFTTSRSGGLKLDLEDEEPKEIFFQCVKPPDVFNNCKHGISGKDEKLVDEFILAQGNKNTVSTTSEGVDAFTKYMRKQGEVRKIEEIPLTELCLLPSKFVIEARREDGIDFEPDTFKFLHQEYPALLK